MAPRPSTDFRLTGKAYITASLLADEQVAAAVRTHAVETQMTERDTWRQVRRYVDEIVPAFNLLAYYKVGIAASRFLLDLFYETNIEYVDAEAFNDLPRESIVIYLMNHRSNADYVLAGYALAGQVAISYAVGEWARVFPLEYLFKTFGSYFIRRRFREPLYHTVLERYVQLMTRNGVTQGIFPEGGLSRDGRLRPAKIGLLDYSLGVAREAAFAERMYIVPVAIGYDRVLEDRSLLRELRASEGHRPPGRIAQLRQLLRFAVWNGGRLLTRRWKRYGEAAVVIGTPVPIGPWLRDLDARGRGLFTLARKERLGEVQAFVDEAMRRVGEIVPVTAVPLTCAAIQTIGADFISRAALLERVEELRASLIHRGSHLVHAGEPIDVTLERAIAVLTLRRVVAMDGAGFVVLPRGRELVSYYANSIAHLLGDFEEAVRTRDALPLYAAIDQ